MKITEEQVNWLEEDLQESLNICNSEEDWYYIQSIEKMNDGKYFIFMKSECYKKIIAEIVCDLYYNGDTNPIGISNEDFATHGFPCNSENVYKFSE